MARHQSYEFARSVVMIAGDNDMIRGATLSVDLATLVTVSATYVRGVVAYAVTRGLDRGALLCAAGVTDADLAVDDVRLPMHALIAVLRAGAAHAHDPAFALHCGDHVPCEQVSLASPLGQAATTVLGALQQVNRYARLGIDFPTIGAGDRFRIEVNAAGAWFVDLRPHDAWPEITELVFARIARGMSRAAGRSVLRAVHVTHAVPAHSEAYDNVFKVPMVFDSARNALLLDPAFLDTSLTAAPTHVTRIIATEADTRLCALDAQRTVRGRVESVLRARLASADVGVDRVARALAMSRRTLHRKLKAEGATFERTLDDLRRSVALERLHSGGVTVREAAALVGFSDPAAFSRAFKRWTGESPSASLPPTTPPCPAYQSRS